MGDSKPVIVVTGEDVVRRRPDMYVGSVDDPEVVGKLVGWVLKEIAYPPTDDAGDNIIRVCLKGDGSVAVSRTSNDVPFEWAISMFTAGSHFRHAGLHPFAQGG